MLCDHSHILYYTTSATDKAQLHKLCIKVLIRINIYTQALQIIMGG